MRNHYPLPWHANAVAACRFAQQQFATPEQAATALAEAISQPNEAALSEVLGDNWQQFLPTDGSTLPPSIAFNATGR